MIRARGAAAVVGATLLVACGSSPGSSPASTGSADNVTGTIQRGASQTCPADEPCDPVAVAVHLVFSSAGRADVTVPVNGDGSFATHLDPGVYSITAEPPPFRGQLEPSRVDVPESGTVELRLQVVTPAT